MVEEGEQDAKNKATEQVADESYLQEEGSSKTDNLTMISCSVEEKLNEEVSSNSFIDRLLYRYAKFIVGYPYVNIIIMCIVVIWAAVIGFVPKLGAQKLPDFSKPTKGFEARDTETSNSKHAYQNLQTYLSGATHTRLKRSLINLEWSCSYSFPYESYVFSYNKIVYKHKSGGNMLSAENMIDVCRLQESIMQTSPFYAGEVRKSNGKNCPSHSIPNYIAILANRSSCLQIMDSDVSHFQALLSECAKHFKDGSLKSCLKNSICTNFAPNCINHKEIIYYTFQFLSDINFASNPSFLRLTLASERLNTLYNSPLYEPVYKNKLKDLSVNSRGNVKTVAFYFNDLKFTIFEKTLFLEGALLSVAVLIVFVLIMVYSRSIFIGLMTFFCIIIATVLAYFFYGIVFRISFFPFLNVLTLIFLVGIGADDAFVYMGAWNEAMKSMPHDNNNSKEEALVRWTVYSLKHAVSAMFVTSFTTAAAFYASASSKIIAIRCFGIFAGTSILMNYLMMIVWFPVAVVISYKYFSSCHCASICCHQRVAGSTSETFPQSKSGILPRISSFAKWFSQYFFTETIPNIVTKLRYLWVVILSLLGIGGIIVLFVSPKLRLPVSKDFQMFSDTSSIEQFQLHYKSSFATEEDKRYVVFTFGVSNKNTASMLDPDDKGKLQFINTFSVTSMPEQSWLKSFCEQLQNASFITKLSYNNGACPQITSMFQKLTLPCNNSTSLPMPCCGQTFPLPQSTFSQCLSGLLPNSSNTFYTRRDHNYNPGGIIGEKKVVKAISISVETTFQYTDSYDESKKFFNTVNSWFQSVISNAPASFKSGFWHSELTFYDLQTNLATGTQVALGISVAIAFCVVLLTTWNLLISLLTIVSIAFVMSTSMGTLVLAGWKLNIMESLIFSVAVGLAVDFTLHYGVAYRSAIDKSSRESRVNYSFTHLGSAVAMGACTTFISGMVMAPATVLVYIQLSHFLMGLMTFSWVYANFFFMALCTIMGPKNEMCQLNIISLLFKRGRKKEQMEKADGHEMQNVA